jgi:hypothetical protein
MLLDDIIADLAGDKPLVTTMLKTKILLADLDQPDLIQWVNRELNGYAADDQLPEYRTVTGFVRGNIRSMVGHAQGHPLPLGHLSKEERDNLQKILVTESLTAIAELAQGDGPRRPIPLEANGKLSEVLTDGWHVELAWIDVNVAQLKNIETQVRSRLLDFLLVLRANSGKNATEQHLKASTSGLDIPGIFQGAVFGDNAVITVGANNQITATNVKNDTDLFAELQKLGVSSDDVQALDEAFKADRSAGGRPSMSGHTGGWWEKLLDKARSGVGHISTLTVAHTIAGLLVKYIEQHGG